MKISTFLKSLFCCIALFLSLQAKLQIITTVAGNGFGGYSGDSGLALNAGLNSWHICFDAHKNMLITDYDNHVVRKVDASTGIITTIAGTGIAGFSGDNVPAVQAQLNRPFDVTTDSSGNIYIVDLANYRVRKIDASTGIITTIAGTGAYAYSGDGGLAVNAGLKEPVGVAIDSSNKNLYILEAFGSRIRKVDLSTGVITTIAGNGIQRSSGDGGLAINAEIDEPLAMAIDSHNNIYFNETNYRVRKINASDGTIHTIAGTGVQGDAGDGGLAINAQIQYSFGLAVDKNNNVYLTELLAGYIRKINLNDSIITTVAGTGKFGYNGDGILATQADINQPNGIVTDSKGNFFFADGMRVRKITVDSSALDEIFGYAYYDLNSNNVKDSAEPFFSAGKIVSKKKTDSIVTITSGGNFRIGVDTGKYNSSFTPFKNYYTVIPQKHTSIFSDYSQIDTIHFAMQPVSGNQDANISMYSFMPPIPGFDVPYRIRYKNEGTDTIANGVIQLIKDPRVTLVSASPSYASINGDTIRWNYTNLNPLDTASVLIYFNFPATTHIGDTIHSTASITPVKNDLMPADNSVTLNQILVGSFDPNNKSENHAGAITTTQVNNGDYLTYTIHFQNTGTYAAFNIVVKDTLSNKLDWNTFEMVDASNNYQLDISGGNKCTWYFNGIGLPDSNTNEPASHGYIVYRIKPKNTLTGGNIINNSAGIYFDYNQPVETNTEKTIVQNMVLPVQLLSFTAEHNGKTNLLKWSTANEINTSHFEVQRSSDGRKFSSIGSVPASGLSKLQNNYAYNDEQPLKAINYYRLKMADKDGRYSYSIIRSIDNTGSFDVMLYPNPVKDLLTLNFTARKTMTIKIEVTAADGKIVFTEEMQLVQGESKQTINTAVLRAGHYFIKCTAPDEIRTLKLVKQ